MNTSKGLKFNNQILCSVVTLNLFYLFEFLLNFHLCTKCIIAHLLALFVHLCVYLLVCLIRFDLCLFVCLHICS